MIDPFPTHSFALPRPPGLLLFPPTLLFLRSSFAPYHASRTFYHLSCSLLYGRLYSWIDIIVWNLGVRGGWTAWRILGGGGRWGYGFCDYISFLPSFCPSHVILSFPPSNIPTTPPRTHLHSTPLHPNPPLSKNDRSNSNINIPSPFPGLLHSILTSPLASLPSPPPTATPPNPEPSH